METTRSLAPFRDNLHERGRCKARDKTNSHTIGVNFASWTDIYIWAGAWTLKLKN